MACTNYGIADNIKCRKTGVSARLMVDEKNQFLYRCDRCSYEGAIGDHFEFTTTSGTIVRELLFPGLASKKRVTDSTD